MYFYIPIIAILHFHMNLHEIFVIFFGITLHNIQSIPSNYKISNHAKKTKESYSNIINTYQADKYTIKDIVEMFSFDRKTIGNIIKKHESGEQFMNTSEKRKCTCKNRNCKNLIYGN